MTPNTVVIHTSTVRPAHFESALETIKRPSTASENTRRRSVGSSKWKRFSDSDLVDYAYIGVTVGATDAYAAGIVEVGSGNARLLTGEYDTVTHAAIVNEFLGILTHIAVRTAVIGDTEYFIERVGGLVGDSLHLFDAHAFRIAQRMPACVVTHENVVAARDAYTAALSSAAFTLVLNTAD